MYYPAVRPQVSSLREPVELRSIQPEQNRFRRYRIVEQGNLLGGADLIIEWGRVGAGGQVRCERFEGIEALQARRRALLHRRRRHGYVSVVASGGGR